MAPITPVGEPSTVAAGDTWTWQQAFSDYPASEGWVISYAIRGVGSLTWDAAWVTYSGTTATVVIPAASTATLAVGVYQWVAYATGSGSYAGQRFEARRGSLEVTRNLATAVAGDAQSWEEEQLAAIEAVLANKITDDVASYQIAGRQLTTIPLNELLSLRSSLKAAVRRQQGKGRWAEHRAVMP